MSNCDCALRNFWDGPCDEHLAEYQKTLQAPAKFTDYGAAVDIEFYKVWDPIIDQAAAEIGWRAGKFATEGLKDEQVEYPKV
jgi:hypothetical protein